MLNQEGSGVNILCIQIHSKFNIDSSTFLDTMYKDRSNVGSCPNEI